MIGTTTRQKNGRASHMADYSIVPLISNIWTESGLEIVIFYYVKCLIMWEWFLIWRFKSAEAVNRMVLSGISLIYVPWPMCVHQCNYIINQGKKSQYNYGGVKWNVFVFINSKNRVGQMYRHSPPLHSTDDTNPGCPFTMCGYRLLRAQFRQPKKFANINEMSTKGDLINTMIHDINRYLHYTLNVSEVTFEVRVMRVRQSSQWRK